MSMVINPSGMVVPAGQFKAQCLALIDKVSQTRQSITITKWGKPVARLVPLEDVKSRRLFGYFAGHVLEEGDIVNATGERWEAEGG